ncbi:MAG: SDR family NAD(P)-dependent oxidoreductase [Clostridia bacterium]|nr:SDR family NAD(P)-dependent oxidoreductase [Clostridia bacterium]
MSRIVIISGGTSGMGKKVAERLRKDGDIVLAFGRNPDLKNLNEFSVDVTKELEVESFFEEIKNKYGKIDILINSAGYGISGAAEIAKFDEVKNLFNVNYFGTLKCCQCALPLMNEGAKIIDISSCCAIFAMPFRIHYCASKAAVSMLSYGLRMELCDAEIDVTVINPGDVKTNFIKSRIKNLETNKKYGDKVANAQELVEKNNSKRMSVEYAAEKIYKIVNKKKMKAMYIIGRKYKFFNFLLHLFPINFFLKISNKIFGGRH